VPGIVVIVAPFVPNVVSGAPSSARAALAASRRAASAGTAKRRRGAARIGQRYLQRASVGKA
jgi:hypothetical protein